MSADSHKSYLSSLGITEFNYFPDDELPPNTVQLKTLVWTASCEPSSSSNAGGLGHRDGIDMLQVKVFTTLLLAVDFVDENILLEVIRSKYGSNKMTISLTEKDVAEQMTGYKSGTMSPIFQLSTMDLFFEKNIEAAIKNNDGFVSVGSGIPFFSLYISWDSLLRAARSTSFVNLCHFSRCITKNERLADVPEGPSRNSSKSISRQLLDAAGKKGRWLQVKSLIDQIGPNFPSVSFRQNIL